MKNKQRLKTQIVTLSLLLVGYVLSAAPGTLEVVGRLEVEGGATTHTGTGSTANSAATGSATDAVAVGSGNQADAENSVVVGTGLQSAVAAVESVTLGKYNSNVPAVGSWTPADLLLVVGDGASNAARSNALVVLKDGTVIMTKVQGDIGMGPFTAQ